jgi:hypothetical protein
MADPAVLRTELLTAALDGTPGVERVTVARVELAPEMMVGPGDAFHEPAGAEISHFDNASDDEPVVFVACYLLAPGADRLIEML